MLKRVQHAIEVSMGQTKKAKIMFTCSHETKADLTEWSQEERRTLSNLVEGIVVEALKQKQENQIDHNQEKSA
ncbi:hypothetical protein [Anabaena sp. CCY 0017]|uniref:hypothetical protein n=1 Tax=Anabaena sp. CCY 0017 TaxID=3103866 RepID=UPI0039C5F659